MKTKDLIDDKTSYSTTRWAFVVAMRFAIIMISLSFIAFVTFKIVGIETEGLFSGVSTVLGIVVGLATTAKALQGFETTDNNNIIDENNNDNEIK